MKLQEIRAQLAECGRQMSAAGLSTGTSGNLSVYDPQECLMAITPSGLDYFSITPADIVVTDLEAHVVEGERKPSSEWALHTQLYRRHPAARAVVHTHSVYCTTLAVLGQPLRAVHYAIAAAGAAEVPCAPYCLFGTEALAREAVEACGEGRAVLLGNHGLVAWGESLPGAYGLARDLEFVAELQWRAMAVGTPNVLTKDQMDAAMNRFQTYGQSEKRADEPQTP
ncbi:class II aldolase/adducin family protein [Oscillibacter sp.]|uniref:class II aldolase/adducin family protein n=1 Tax=Oscillibacter sp. TaxID=1945593 RepID=UPI00262021E6|nr:class II aldolase/adducin family protein [Oscillibacter sp.]MDD3347255.1 class II aldolase/adducin family protein [Oscillibacter sp.]